VLAHIVILGRGGRFMVLRGWWQALLSQDVRLVALGPSDKVLIELILILIVFNNSLSETVAQLFKLLFHALLCEVAIV